jgi:photosystem II stability/assembly factor-like uncharacterized protein
MIDKIKFIILLLTVNILIFSCTKHHDSPGTPAQPELLDTLGAGWQRIQIDPTLNFEDIFFVNNQTGYLCGDHYLGKSTDGGLTWKLIIPDSLKAVFENLFFTDAKQTTAAIPGKRLTTAVYLMDNFLMPITVTLSQQALWICKRPV